MRREHACGYHVWARAAAPVRLRRAQCGGGGGRAESRRRGAGRVIADGSAGEIARRLVLRRRTSRQRRRLRRAGAACAERRSRRARRERRATRVTGSRPRPSSAADRRASGIRRRTDSAGIGCGRCGTAGSDGFLPRGSHRRCGRWRRAGVARARGVGRADGDARVPAWRARRVLAEIAGAAGEHEASESRGASRRCTALKLARLRGATSPERTVEAAFSPRDGFQSGSRQKSADARLPTPWLRARPALERRGERARSHPKADRRCDASAPSRPRPRRRRTAPRRTARSRHIAERLAASAGRRARSQPRSTSRPRAPPGTARR